MDGMTGDVVLPIHIHSLTLSVLTGSLP